MKTEAVGQDKMSDEQLELVDKLLNEYATISIENDGNTVYEGAVSGKPDMQNKAISLGTVKAGASKDMSVKLTLSPEMDNQYLDLLGKVRWVFTANGEDDPVSTPVNTPKTGDINMVPAMVSFATATLLLGAGIILLRKKDDENA